MRFAKDAPIIVDGRGSRLPTFGLDSEPHSRRSGYPGQDNGSSIEPTEYAWRQRPFKGVVDHKTDNWRDRLFLKV
jgi:hypothetical protein